MDAQISADVSDPRKAASRLNVAVVNYGMGNLRSVVHALEFLGCTPQVADAPDALKSRDAIILPGVGAFGEAMSTIERQGLVAPLTDAVVERGTPFLGICLGMQLVAATSEEHGHHKGLGWIDAHVRPINPDRGRVPHVGWSEVSAADDDPLFTGIDASASYYFDHSYHMEIGGDARVTHVQYGRPMVAAFSKGSLFATQFHPEKSQRAGLKLLRNFLNHALESVDGGSA